MSKKRKDASLPADNGQGINANKVRIADGAGRQPIVVDYIEGETYKKLLKRAGVKLDGNHIATIGKGVIKDLNCPVERGVTVTIANTPGNG